MALQDFAGIFSRYFVVGYFIPTFFALLALWQVLSEEMLPNAFSEQYEGAVAVAVLGALSVPIALVLLGLSFPIIRVFEGYFLLEGWIFGLSRVLNPLGQLLIALQTRTYRRLVRERELGLDSRMRSASATRTNRYFRPFHRIWVWLRARTKTRVSPNEDGGLDSRIRSLAAYRLDRYFPPDSDMLLPTRFGNTIRAWEFHAVRRWGLDTIAVWPRVDQLLNEQEQQLHDDARTDVGFFVNSCIAAIAVGVVLIVDWIRFRSFALEDVWWVVAFPVAYVLYRGACEAAARWGTEVRSSIDLHRLELYEKLGLRRPARDEDERAIAKAVNECLLYGIAIPDEYRDPTESTMRDQTATHSPERARDLSAWPLFAAAVALAAWVRSRRRTR